MRYRLLACDYDGTIAHHGKVSPATMRALLRLRATGRRLALVTGRELEDLLTVCPYVNLFDWVVAENGALLYQPSTQQEKVLAERPPETFSQLLRERGVEPLSCGRAIVATWEPHQAVVLDAIRELGLELQVIFNKGAVMVLPAGVNKATGLTAALAEMNLSPHETVGVGDAENDHAFLNLCEFSAAVSNALPALKERADLVLAGDHGAGVAELIDQMIADDLASYADRLARHDLALGADDHNRQWRIPAFGPSVLIAGPSGSGKSTTTTSLMERMADQHYQFCAIDPEGDYDTLEFAIVIGNGQHAPEIDDVLRALSRSDQNVTVNLIGLRLTDRPEFFIKLLMKLVQLRQQLGRPHWIVVDEAHHLLPRSWQPGELSLVAELNRLLLITVHPDEVHAAVLASVGTVIAVGHRPDETIRTFCRTQHEEPPPLADVDLDAREVLVWPRHDRLPPRSVQVTPHRSERQRHIRKYTEGVLPPDRSFYFRGPRNKLNLRAQNLMLFLQTAEGVDDVTWLHHLRKGDYSHWFRTCIKDEELAGEAADVEARKLSAAESRRQIREAIERRYTLPLRAE